MVGLLHCSSSLACSCFLSLAASQVRPERGGACTPAECVSMLSSEVALLSVDFASDVVPVVRRDIASTFAQKLSLVGKLIN